jgi:hypothetical protein
MFIDKLLLLSDAQAFTADAVSTNTVDLGAAAEVVGTGEEIGIAFAVDVAADFTTGDETYVFELLSDDDAALGSPTIVLERAILASALTAGSLHFLPIPPGTPVLRYLGYQLDVTGTTPSVTLTAWVTSRAMFSVLAKSYPKGYSV